MIRRLFKGVLRRTYKNLRILKFNILSTNTFLGKNPRKYQPVIIMGKGKIYFGDDVRIGVVTSPKFWSSECYIEARSEFSAIEIGSNTWINNSFSVIADKQIIKIGKDCLIGHDVFIIDSDFHCTEPALRHSGGPVGSGPVCIGDNVFIGSRVIVIKNSVIGNGSVVAAGAVVSGQFPENSLIAGSPAKLVRKI